MDWDAPQYFEGMDAFSDSTSGFSLMMQFFVDSVEVEVHLGHPELSHAIGLAALQKHVCHLSQCRMEQVQKQAKSSADPQHGSRRHLCLQVRLLLRE